MSAKSSASCFFSNAPNRRLCLILGLGAVFGGIEREEIGGGRVLTVFRLEGDRRPAALDGGFIELIVVLWALDRPKVRLGVVVLEESIQCSVCAFKEIESFFLSEIIECI